MNFNLHALLVSILKGSTAKQSVRLDLGASLASFPFLVDLSGWKEWQSHQGGTRNLPGQLEIRPAKQMQSSYAASSPSLKMFLQRSEGYAKEGEEAPQLLAQAVDSEAQKMSVWLLGRHSNPPAKSASHVCVFVAWGEHYNLGQPSSYFTCFLA